MLEVLRGLRVLEVGGDVAVRYCGHMFARLGAAVTRVGGSDDSRLGQGGTAGVAYGAWLDQDKTIAASPEGDFDLVIGGQTRVDAAALRSLAAGLPGAPPTVTITWFGESGPYADWMGTDGVISALTGCTHVFGEVDGPPVTPQGHAPQVAGAVNGFIAGLAALMAKDRPTRADVGIFESAMCWVEPGTVAAYYTGLPARRLGVNRLAPSYPCQVYAASDGWIGVTSITPAQWRALATLVGRPELGVAPQYAMSVMRLLLADELDAVIAPVIAKRTVMEWVKEGQTRRIPIAPVRRPAELIADPHWSARGSFRETPVAGVSGPDLPFRFRWDGRTAPRPTGGQAGPLAGIRVADFSMGWAGPLGARYLADLGADVRKVEAAGHPDWWRGWEDVPDADPPPHELARNFMVANRNKRGLDLDFDTPQGMAAARALIADADIVIENLGPGVMDARGLSPAEIRALSPGVIAISMPPFGRGGPLGGVRAYGSTVEHASGMPFINGHAAWPPALQHVAFGDPVAGLYCAAAAMAALWARERLGGAEIELCQVECLFQMGAEGIIGEQARGTPSPRNGSARATTRLSTVVATAVEDAWLAVIAETDAQLEALCGVVGADGDVEAALKAWAAEQWGPDAAATLQTAGVPAAPVNLSSDMIADPHLSEADFWVVQQRRHLGEHITPAAPMRFDGERPPVVRPAPVLGEHTEEVLAELSAGQPA